MKKTCLFIFGALFFSNYLEAVTTQDLIVKINAGDAQAFEKIINDELYRQRPKNFNDMLISLKCSGIDLNTPLFGTDKNANYSIRAIDLLLLTVGRMISYDHELFHTYYGLLETLLKYGADINVRYPRAYPKIPAILKS